MSNTLIGNVPLGNGGVVLRPNDWLLHLLQLGPKEVNFQLQETQIS